MNQFAHASVIMFATSDGRMSECLSGVNYPVRDARLALINASHLKICFRKVLVSAVLLQLCPIVWEIHSCDAFAWIGCRDHVDSHLAWTLLSHAEGANASERGCGLAVCRSLQKKVKSASLQHDEKATTR